MKRFVVGPLLFCGSVLACGQLFDDPVQCATDADCNKFSNAVCDLANGGVCIQSNGNDDDSGGSSSGTSSNDDATTGTGDGASTDRCNMAGKATASIGTKLDGGGRSEITGSVTLACDTDWTLDSLVFVRKGATLTIEAGTTIHAKKGVGAGIIVSTGGRIVAQGKSDLPIVITSDATPATPGDWRGLFVLGLAPPGGQPPFEDDPDLAWGGANADDDSGVVSYVRIEYAKTGLVFAGVGKKTKIDFVEVRRSTENCFMFFGGRADSKHLVCQSPGANQFEWWYGAQGRAQFLYGQKAALPPIFNSHGLLVDDAKPLIYNATICGDKPAALNGYGVLYRDGATLDLNGSIVSGWFAGFDATGDMGMPGTMHGSVVFGNKTNPAWAETPEEGDPSAPDFDDDNGIEEIDDFNAATPANTTADPKLVDCFDPKSPKPWPQTSLTTNAPTPPTDPFFDTNAKYIGAFKDATDTWMQGAWVRFDDK